MNKQELNKVQKWLSFSKYITVLTLFLWVGAAPMVLMVLAAGISTATITFAAITWLYPVWPIGFTILAGRMYKTEKYRSSIIFSILAIMPCLILFILFFLP